MCYIVRLKRRTICPFENIVIFLICTAKLSPVFFLLCFGSKKDATRFGRQGKSAAAALGLGFVLLDARHHLADSMAYQQTVVFKVYAVPLQAQHFAAAQAI